MPMLHQRLNEQPRSMRLAVFATLPFGSPKEMVQGVQGTPRNTNKHNEHNKNCED